MLFAFVEDGTLQVLAGVEDARREHEGVDVESGTVTFFDEDGRPLEPVFRVPNRTGKVLGLLSWGSSGVFDLEPAAEPPGDPLWLALQETQSLAPNPWFASLADVVAHLRARGAVVEAPTRSAP